MEKSKGREECGGSEVTRTSAREEGGKGVKEGGRTSLVPLTLYSCVSHTTPPFNFPHPLCLRNQAHRLQKKGAGFGPP